MVTTRDIEYDADGSTMIGRLALPDGDDRRPRLELLRRQLSAECPSREILDFLTENLLHLSYRLREYLNLIEEAGGDALFNRSIVDQG